MQCDMPPKVWLFVGYCILVLDDHAEARIYVEKEAKTMLGLEKVYSCVAEEDEGREELERLNIRRYCAVNGTACGHIHTLWISGETGCKFVSSCLVLRGREIDT